MPERRPRLEGKVAIVTGAGSSGPGSGTGKAAAVLFAREGAKVLLVARVATPAAETLAAIHDEGGDASVCAAAVINPADCQGMVDTARARSGRLDILGNTGGMRGPAWVGAIGHRQDVRRGDTGPGSCWCEVVADEWTGEGTRLEYCPAPGTWVHDEGSSTPPAERLWSDAGCPCARPRGWCRREGLGGSGAETRALFSWKAARR
jgi:hypothetical protein